MKTHVVTLFGIFLDCVFSQFSRDFIPKHFELKNTEDHGYANTLDEDGKLRYSKMHQFINKKSPFIVNLGHCTGSYLGGNWVRIVLFSLNCFSTVVENSLHIDFDSWSLLQILKGSQRSYNKS